MVSVVIPTYNSSKYLTQCLNSLSNCQNISEIVISDDNSDHTDVLLLKEIIFNHQLKSKIKLFENNKNKGAYLNKLESVKNTNYDLIYILDSDNIAGFNLDKVLNKIIRIDDESKLFIPSKIYHFYNSTNIFTPLYKSIIGKQEIFTKANLEINGIQIKNIFQGGENIMYEKNKSIYWILNIGNFIFNKDNFLKSVQNELNLSREVLSMDAVAFTYYWLRNGNTLHLMNSHYHFHRKRGDSVSFTERDNSTISRNHFDKLFLQLGT